MSQKECKCEELRKAMISLIDTLLISDTTTDGEDSHCHTSFDDSDRKGLQDIRDRLEYEMQEDTEA